MNNTSKIHLFCVPSAGSSASIFAAWDKVSTDSIRVIALEYPGHGRKIQQPLSHDPDFLAAHFATEILAYGDVPYALFGHSVGASLIWHIEAKLKSLHAHHDLLLKIVSARPAPDFQQSIRHYGQMTDAQIIQELKLYNNFPDEILNNAHALNFFLPIIKNDFLLSDQMCCKAPNKSTAALISIYGQDDPYLDHPAVMDGWQKYSERWLGTYRCEGDHFYFLRADVLKQTLHIIENNIFSIMQNTSV